jgi:hypothetical protein
MLRRRRGGRPANTIPILANVLMETKGDEYGASARCHDAWTT